MKNSLNLDHTVNSITHLNKNMTVCGGNAAFFERINMDVAVCQQRDLQDLLPDDWWQHIYPLLQPAIEGHSGQACWQIQCHKQGTLSKMAFVSPYFSGDQQVAGITLSVVEQADQLSMQQQLAKILKDFENYKLAIDAHSIVAITDHRGIITHVNEKFCDISQYEYHELVGSTHKIINSGYHPRTFFKTMWKTIAQGQIWKGEICNRTKHGNLYWVDTTIVPLKDNNGLLKNYISIRTDITQLKSSEDHAKYMALYDELTGLPNRRYVKERLKQVIQASKDEQHHSAIMMMDLDNFKTVNDTLGHDYGDHLLKMVAKRVSKCVRETETTARLGGDELLIILSHLSEDEATAHQQAHSIAERISQVIYQPFVLENQVIQTSASIGIFVFKDDSIPQNALLKYADMALYQAKANGKNCICTFDPLMESQVVSRASLISDLRQALIRDEFELYYQAIVDQHKTIIGYEALLRWIHPVRGLILPGEFIEQVEKSDLIHHIGNRVLRMACQQLYQWSQHEHSAHWTVSVNISVQQFRQSDFEDNVMQIIRETEANPHRLRLELTESMFYRDMHSSIQKMKKLIEIGVRFSMDDFGTGYSSLNYLKLLPLDQLKIDRSFVKNIVDNPRDLAIVNTIIRLAHLLDLNIVAEGVETQEQLDCLKENQCFSFQGFLFGQPLPIKTLYD